MSKYGAFSGPYFPVGLNTKIYSVNLPIQSEYRKIRTRKTPYLDTFHAVILCEYFAILRKSSIWFDSNLARKFHHFLHPVRLFRCPLKCNVRWRIQFLYFASSLESKFKVWCRRYCSDANDVIAGIRSFESEWFSWIKIVCGAPLKLKVFF